MSDRLFLAIPLAEVVREAIESWARRENLRETGWRLVKKENLHLTLRFLGQTQSAVVPPLEEGMSELARGHEPFETELAGWGVFPDHRRPRVIWIGLDGQLSQLRTLASAVEELSRSLGFPAEPRPFRAHLTVGRASRRGRGPRLVHTPDPLSPRLGSLPVEEVVLYRSFLEPTGARYQPMATFPLGRAS